MDEKIKSTIEKIKLLAQQNTEFSKEMHALFGKSETSVDLPILSSVSSDVTAIRSALEIRATESLKYSFVKVPRLRDQLIIDNLRMENAALNLQERESDRFYIFCVNAFYQLENIINYYYHVMFPNINSLLTEIERATSTDPEKYKFKRAGTEKNVADIAVYYKITSICNSLFPENISLKSTLNNLRKIRNDGEHRCQVLMEKRDESNNLYQFLQSATFNSVRVDLIKVVSAIEDIMQERVVEGVITTMLASSCFVSYDGKTEQLPTKLFCKVKHLKAEDKIAIVIQANKIIDIKE
jgi:hypothetical protein